MTARRWTFGIVVLLGALAACSGGDDAATTTSTPETAAPTTTPTSSTAPSTTAPATTAPTTTLPVVTTTTEPPPGVDEAAQRRPASPLSEPSGSGVREPAPPWTEYAPLTGRPYDPAIADRPALAVKIDNSPEGQPHYNLADADVVIEENVESITRFVAVFHTNMPDRIGPVRSARESDIDILAGLNRPILAWSGGNDGVTSRVRNAHSSGWLANLSAQITDCYWRSGLRRSPHNLMLDPQCARDSATFAGPAQPLFAGGYGPLVAGAGTPAATFSIEMDGIVPTWDWDALTERWVRSQRGGPHVDVDGERVGAENVVVLRVKYVASDADPRSPEAVTVGFGPAIVYRDGRRIEATWSRADRFAAYDLRDQSGRPVVLAPGTTFVELARNQG